MMLHRKEHIESTLKRAISRVLSRGLSDPRIAGLVSVTRVDISPDCRNATVFVSIIPDQYEKRTLHGLTHARGHITSLLRKEVVMRSAPHLRFCLDPSLKKQADIFDAIKTGLAQDRVLQEDRINRVDPPSTHDPEDEIS